MAEQIPSQRESRSERLLMLHYELARLCGRDVPAPAGVLPELRRWYWRFVRGHEYEICGECGRPVSRSTGPTWWSAPDWLWERVTGGPNGVLCMPCFAARVEVAGYGMHWYAAGPEFDFAIAVASTLPPYEGDSPSANPRSPFGV